MASYALGADICPHCGCELTPQEVTRGVQANRYYWAILHIIGEHIGESAEGLHHAFKDKFLARENLLFGLRVVPSSRLLSQQRFFDYVNEIRQWSHSFLGLYIDTPEEYEMKRRLL